MMVAKSLYVAGPPGSGKTGVCAALAMKLREEGLRVAYFKPVGYAPGRQGWDMRRGRNGATRMPC